MRLPAETIPQWRNYADWMVSKVPTLEPATKSEWNNFSTNSKAMEQEEKSKEELEEKNTNGEEPEGSNA